ncbi:hypothetical protein EDB81DRAFT_930899 [Dactylonectria macrodidyma]|uniref:NmrA-like domain-containing protein n=1 Tax=Dactylonectria macrodidyma TaxID=307937 RepID=A0A9P9JBG4_9HYPO|nr:hypothetical protein EDB81DRAFT_930899 [Dactylonectria macrodidyma]
MAKIFITGASGYIGGDVLHLLATSHPQYRVRALIRDAAKGEAVKMSFSHVQVVKGGLDDVDLIAQEAKDADVVLHLASTGHLMSVQTIHQALSSRAKGEKPPYWIQISGGSVLAAPELAIKSRVFGSGSDTIYDDLLGLETIRSLIKQHPNRAVDNYLFSVAANTPRVKTALVAPPIIYGQGRGSGNRRSIQIPELTKVTLQRQKGLQISSGLSRWGNIHVQDLSQLLLQLVEKAVEGVEDTKIWGSNGFYLTGVGELSFGEISRRIASAAYDLKLIPNKEVDQVSGEEADKLLPHGSVLYGTNARGRANRAEAVLGWKPQKENLEHEIPRLVAQEAHSLGLLQGPWRYTLVAICWTTVSHWVNHP